MVTVTYPTNFTAVPCSYPLKPSEGPKSIPATCNFVPGSADAFLINLQATLGLGVTQLCSVYVDNTNSPGRTIISLTGSNEQIIAEPYTRGVYPCAGQTLTLTVSTSSPIDCTVPLIFYNFVVPPFIDASITTALGSSDVPAATRSGTLSGSFALPSSTAGIQVTGLFDSVAYPYYYITNISLLYTGSASALGSASFLVCDVNGAGTSINKTFFEPTFYYPSGFGSIKLLELDDLNLFGTEFLGVEILSPFTGGTFTLSVVGGVSNTVP